MALKSSFLVAALDGLLRQEGGVGAPDASVAHAILHHGEFCQPIDPLSGEFTQPDPGGYSSSALVFLSFASALRETS
jgi:hypothetical protein